MLEIADNDLLLKVTSQRENDKIPVFAVDLFTSNVQLEVSTDPRSDIVAVPVLNVMRFKVSLPKHN